MSLLSIPFCFPVKSPRGESKLNDLQSMAGEHNMYGRNSKGLCLPL